MPNSKFDCSTADPTKKVAELQVWGASDLQKVKLNIK